MGTEVFSQDLAGRIVQTRSDNVAIRIEAGEQVLGSKLIIESQRGRDICTEGIGEERQVVNALLPGSVPLVQRKPDRGKGERKNIHGQNQGCQFAPE